MWKKKKECPFCDCTSVWVLSPNTSPNTSSHKKGFQAECINCGARGPCGYKEARGAIGAWNNGILDGVLKRQSS